MSALGTDTARQSESIKETFAAGVERQLAMLSDENVSRADLINTFAHLVGALVLSVPARIIPRWLTKFWMSAALAF
jgi:TetR/AcrR family transcriptional repressor of nem operon